MDNEDEIRRNWRYFWLSLINQFSDKELQRNLWDGLLLPYGGSYPDSADDYLCIFPRKMQKEEIIKSGTISEAEYDAVINFNRMLFEYNAPDGRDYDVDIIMQDPEWDKVVNEATNAKNKLIEIIEDPYEKEFLTQDVLLSIRIKKGKNSVESVSGK